MEKYIKEYNKYDKLIFESEYLNGERSGKGKEYYDDNNKILYDGEYLLGKRNGKGKEYYYSGSIKYEGDYKHGKKWNIKQYDIKGVLEHELKNGNGIIKEYDNKGLFNF